MQLLEGAGEQEGWGGGALASWKTHSEKHTLNCCRSAGLRRMPRMTPAEEVAALLGIESCWLVMSTCRHRARSCDELCNDLPGMDL